MLKRLQLTLLALFVGVWAMASLTSVKNADGVEIWYDFDRRAKTASVTYKGKSDYTYFDEYIGNVVIPSKVTYEGEEYSVTTIGERAFYGCSSLTSVTIPEGVTEIGEWAFGYCSSLTSITLPESVTEIGYYAFRACYKLYEVYNKSNLTITAGSSENGDVAYYAKKVYTDDSGESKLKTVGDYIFYVDEDNIELLVYLGDETAITLPSDYEGKNYNIGGYAFYVCDALTSITIPEGVTSIGDDAFSGCYALTSITLPESLTSIGNYAFYKCSALTSITLPEGVTSIGKGAFERCFALTSITLPEGVTTIESSAFWNCSSLTSIDVALDNNSYTSIDGVLFSKDQTILIKYPEGKKDVTSYVIPEGVTEIGVWAFFGCSSLTSITIPKGVTEIGQSAFSSCSSLTSITLPEGVTEIGQSAFSSCSSLTSITLPEGVISIGEGAFRLCSSLTSITIPKGVTEIGQSAFSSCSSLTSITLPEGVTEIGQSAFSSCSSLTSITIPKGVTEIGQSAFLDCSSLTSIDVALDNNRYTSIDGVLFSKDKTILIKYPEGKKDVTSYVIPDSVTTIGEKSFCKCNALTSITIPEGVTSIGEYAFYNCSGLTSITSMNATPPSIGNYYTFDGVDKSIPVYVPKQSVDNYWGYFTNIQGIDDTPITDVVADSVSIRLIGNSLIVEGAESYAVYALSGQCLGKVESLERGLYIVVADGVSKKIVVK